MAKKIGIVLLSIIIILATAATAVMVTRFALGKGNGENSGGGQVPAGSGDKLFDSHKVPFVKEKVTVSVRVIEDGLQNVGKLVTQEYYFTLSENYEKKVSAGLLSSTAYTVFSYDGVVNAGIECDDIRVRRDEEKKLIYVTIPRAEILDVVIDYDSFQEIDSKQGIWSKIKLSDINKAMQELVKKAELNALEKGVLKKADENAELVLERLVKDIIESSEYDIIFEHR